MFKFREQKTPATYSTEKMKVLSSLDPDTHDKLKKLSISCDMTKTKMAETLIKMAVNHNDIINHYQNLYNKEEQYRVIPTNQKGKVYY